MNARGSEILLEAVVSTPCCREASEIYDWHIFEGNSKVRLGILLNEEQVRFHEKNPQCCSQIGYIIAPFCLHEFPPDYTSKIKPITDLSLVPICVFDYRSLTDPRLRENAIMILSSLRESHFFAYFPDDVNLEEKDKEILPMGKEFKNEGELRIIFFLNLAYNTKILNNPILKKFLDDYLFGRGKKDG